MRATILVGTLRKAGLSNTATLSEFLSRRLEQKGVECRTIRLVDHAIVAGTFSDMGEGDEWPAILEHESDHAGTADRMVSELLRFAGE